MKRPNHRLALCALLAATIAGHAEAQTEHTGSHLTTPAPAEVSDDLASLDAARATLFAFGSCIVASDRRRVERVLQMPPTSRDYGEALRSLATEDCLGSGLARFNFMIMRGSLFVALYRADRHSGDVVLAPQPPDFAAAMPDRTTTEARDFIGLHQFADCAVRAAPAAARAVVLAPVASRSENEAYAALTPHLGGCVQQGMNVRFSRIILAGLIAEALYRESKAAVAPQP